MREDPKLFRRDAHRRAAALYRDARVRRLDARSDKDSYHSFFADHVEADVVGKDRMNGDQSREREVNVMFALFRSASTSSSDKGTCFRWGDRLR